MKSKDVLTRPFGREEVRHRPGRAGESVVYVEGHLVVARLLEAFEEGFSFAVQEYKILDDEVLVLARITAGGVEKMAFGGSAITRARDDRRPVSLVDDIKAAETDAIKRAARLFGVALTLHSSPTTETPPPPSLTDSKAPSNGNAYLSAAQLRAVHALRRRLNMSDEELSDFAARVVSSGDVERLDKRGASRLIELLQAELVPTGAAR